MAIQELQTFDRDNNHRERSQAPHTETEKALRQVYEYGPEPENTVTAITELVNSVGSSDLTEMWQDEISSGDALRLSEKLTDRFRHGIERSREMAHDLLTGKEYPVWNYEEYRERMKPMRDMTSAGQFVNVLGEYAPQRIAGQGPIMIAGHRDLFPQSTNLFLDALTNATVTNFGQGYPVHGMAATAFGDLTGGSQCVAYHPGLLMEEAADAILRIAPIDRNGAKVAWFNAGGDANDVALAAAEHYTTKVHGENGHRKAVFFREAYHGNIEGRSGRLTTGIDQSYHPEDRKHAVQLEFPNHDDEIEPVLARIKELAGNKQLSAVIFEATQGDGGGISMHPDFFTELVKASLDYQVPLICDEVQSGFGRTGRINAVDYLLDHWQNSSYVTRDSYPRKPPMIVTYAKSMTNGREPGSVTVMPKEYAVLERAQGLNTYSAHPGTLATAIVTANLMTPDLLEMVQHKRGVFDHAIEPYLDDNSLIREIRGQGLHLFLGLQPGYSQLIQAQLMLESRILTGTVARNALRIHAPINAPDEVWEAIAVRAGETAMKLQNGMVNIDALNILRKGGPSGLAVR